jgi:hypothetical protein
MKNKKAKEKMFDKPIDLDEELQKLENLKLKR